jgi:transposase
MQGVRVERLDHLGIVAGICREIGLAEYLDALAGPSRQQVSIGTATVAMILNGLGFSNRRLYLVSQFFATKPVEHLLGAGITAEMLHDDCLGRTLDWLHDHDPTALFAGIARQARQRFGIRARPVHVDTTSFAVTGEYDTDLEAHTIAVTYGYSRDHRADLKQWMLALGCHGRPRGQVTCRCSARRWMATPVTRSAWSPPSKRSLSSCVPRARMKRRPPSSWRIAGCTVRATSPD